MQIPQLTVDLTQPPQLRWQALRPYKGMLHSLLNQYLSELGSIDAFRDLLTLYQDQYIPATYHAEIAGIASTLDLSERHLLLGNLYYDALKIMLGCTAFAIDTPQGPLHARNLDWWTENGMLARATIRVHFHGASVGPFELITWPGFIGALSGVAPGRFAITLNAVLSDEPAQLAAPVVFVIRSVFETARTFAEAVEQLASTPLLSDCLLLVTGIKTGEMVVIERTPTRSALRYPQGGSLVVANDYLALQFTAKATRQEQQLQQTSCRRFDRITHLLGQHRPIDVNECFALLTDTNVQMGITVQQMVLSVAQNIVEVRIPAKYQNTML